MSCARTRCAHTRTTYVRIYETGRSGAARTAAIIIAYADDRHGVESNQLKLIIERWKSIFFIHSDPICLLPSVPIFIPHIFNWDASRRYNLSRVEIFKSSKQAPASNINKQDFIYNCMCVRIQSINTHVKLKFLYSTYNI